MVPWKEDGEKCGYKACIGKKSCGFRYSWASRSRCYNCNKVFPTEIEIRPPKPGYLSQAWDRDHRVAGGGKQWGAPLDQVAGWEGQEMDKVTSWEQVKRLLLQAGCSETDQLVQQAHSKLEEAKVQKTEGMPAWVRHKNTTQKLDRKRKALQKASDRQVEAEGEIKALTDEMDGLASQKEKLHREIRELEEEVANFGEGAVQEGLGVAAGLLGPKVVEGLPEEALASGPLAEKVAELQRLAAEATALAKEAKAKVATQAAEAAEKRAADAAAAAGGTADTQVEADDNDIDVEDGEYEDIVNTLLGDSAGTVLPDQRKRVNEQIKGVVSRIRGVRKKCK